MGESLEQADSANLVHLGLIIGGGLSVGVGILNLYWGFGHVPAGVSESAQRIAFSDDFTAVGFSGLDNINILSSAHIAVPLIALGLVMMIGANATAWRRTGGY